MLKPGGPSVVMNNACGDVVLQTRNREVKNFFAGNFLPRYNSVPCLKWIKQCRVNRLMLKLSAA